ncbi:MAG: putative manganese-dependent inorganic diphosphatase [Erysipelotrichaceae bacterium]|nr:putative manganese-dependent inorganic diphosphatase [Erysipelotrichaceae bacterium]
MANNTIYVTGHKNPDSDAIISSMAYAYLKQQLGYDAIAVRAGAINPETEYILNLFNEFPPPLAKDMKTCVRDIDIDEAVTCLPTDTFMTVLSLLTLKKKKVAIVTDNRRHLLGMATISDITTPIVLDRKEKANLLRHTPLENIVDILKGNVLNDAGNNTNGEVYVVNYHNLDCKDKIVVASTHTTRQLEALRAGAKILIICGEECREDVIELARKKGCTLLTTPYSIIEACRDIDLSIPVSLIMSNELITFRYDEHIEDVKTKINKSRFRSYPVTDAHDHVIGTISRFHVLKYASRNLILVDHNEISQSIDGADEANIIEIIDHHRIGGIKTASPVFFRNEQTGSCATIITEMFEEKGVEIPEDLAGMLCSAIISDTVNFRSVTCTQKDIDTARKLAGIANLDLEELAPNILKAGASLKNKTVDAILHNDLKYFEIKKMKVAVGQCNLVNFEDIAAIREKMNRYLRDYATNHSLDICMMVFSLIDGSGSYALVKGQHAEIAQAAFEDIGVNIDGFTYLPKVMSRKLQIIPRITAAAEER